MWLKFVLLVAIIATSRSPLAHGEPHRFESLNEGAIFEILESLMAITVNRTGSRQITAKKFDEFLPPMEGVLSPNAKLDDTEKKFPFLNGPESLFKIDNFLYAAAANAIYRIDLTSGESKIVYDGNAKCKADEQCSRPLGIRIKGDRLLCADAFRGLIEVNLTTGKSIVHLPRDLLIDGFPLRFPDDIDVDWENEIVYMSDASTKWSLETCLWSVVESESSSRIIRFDLKTGKADVFARDIRFANGVQISHDKKFLLVSEFSGRRILKYSLSDSIPASAKSFSGFLPGYPDNIRPSSTGGYWVALPVVSFNQTRSFLDDLRTRPYLAERFGNSALTVGTLVESMGKLLSNDPVRALGSEMRTGMILLRTTFGLGIVLELDVDGNIVQSLQTNQVSLLTEVCEHENGLFCGSFSNKFVLSVPKTKYRNP